MPVKIGSNISSLSIQRNLGDATSRLSNSMEKLSSGLRINRASDDAAGLAISDTLRSSSRIYTTAIRNVNDGMSFLNIADSAMSELANITTRQAELSEQSANGSYSKVQRQALNAEADALVKEFNRIVKSTEFNGRKVIDIEESSGLLRIQAGFGVDGSLGLSVGEEFARYVGTGDFGGAIQYSTEAFVSYAMEFSDIDNDGDLDMVTAGYDGTRGKATIRKNNGDGTFGAAVHYSTEGRMSYAIKFADIDGDGDLDMVTAGYDIVSGKATIRKNNGDGTFGAAVQYYTEDSKSSALQLADIDGDGDLDMVTAGYDFGSGKATIRKNNGDGTFGTAVQYSTEGSKSLALQLADIDGDGDLDMVTTGHDPGSGIVTIRKNNGDGTFGATVQYSAEGEKSHALQLSDIDGDGDLDMVTSGYLWAGANHGSTTIRMNHGDGSFGAATLYSTDGDQSYALQLADIDGDGDLDMVTAGKDGSQGIATIRKNNGNGTFDAAVQYSTDVSFSRALQLADINNDNVLDMVTAGYNGKGSANAQGQATIRTAIGHNVTTIASLNLCTQSNARAALTTTKAQLDRISSERGNIGSAQSRLSIALSTLGTTRENFDSAASRITDVDVAQEAAEMARSEIVQRTASSVLAQANQSPALALKLLQSA